MMMYSDILNVVIILKLYLNICIKCKQKYLAVYNDRRLGKPINKHSTNSITLTEAVIP